MRTVVLSEDTLTDYIEDVLDEIAETVSSTINDDMTILLLGMFAVQILTSLEEKIFE